MNHHWPTNCNIFDKDTQNRGQKHKICADRFKSPLTLVHSINPIAGHKCRSSWEVKAFQNIFCAQNQIDPMHYSQIWNKNIWPMQALMTNKGRLNTIWDMLTIPKCCFNFYKDRYGGNHQTSWKSTKDLSAVILAKFKICGSCQPI